MRRTARPILRSLMYIHTPIFRTGRYGGLNSYMIPQYYG
jgi:hypothetical protein